jgi:fibronectin type 3 domain-containing protein
MGKRRRNLTSSIVLTVACVVLSSCGGSSGGGGQQVMPPATPTGLAATAGNAQVSLTWNASTGATSYTVGRGTVTGGPYSTTFSASTTSYTDTTAANGTTYYYVVAAVNSAGASANSSQVSATPSAPAAPATPTGLAATAGNNQVILNWNASTGATSYNVGRGTVNGGPYSTTFSASTTSYTDTTAANGTTYYYVVAAVNAVGTSANSGQVSAKPTGPSTSIVVTIDVLANRHTISPYVYGGAFPQDAPTIRDTGLTVVRWGGNAASTYNWQLGTNNADNDYYFEDYSFGALNNSADSSSTQFITDVKTAGSAPLMTMVMLPWVAQSPETSVTQGGVDNYHWTFSVSQDNACGAVGKVDQYNTDAGINLQADCSTTMVASLAQLNRTYFPLLDDSTQTCPVGTCVFRKDWATALATAFGTGSCPIPNSSITSCHFYDMDNEIDIWGGTHVDVHPNPTTYPELRDIYLTEAAKLKSWDPQAVRMGWVSCCWYYYWNSAAGDKGTRANIDFMPWWLNEVAWQDEINGARTLDILDLHAYPETSIPSLTATTKALVLRSTRDWWDPSYTSEAWFGTNSVTAQEPHDGIAFRIPRARAWANAIYPGTPLAFTEWNFDLGNESDFSTALADVDAYGVLGRERVSLSTRWTTPSPSNPNYLALKLFTNYDAAHHGFATTSVSDTNNGSPGLFSSYAAVNSAGTQMTLMVLNKDPANTASVQFAFNGFTASSVVSYTLAQSAPTKITSASASWSATQNFAPYTATMLVIAGTTTTSPVSSWDLNPDTTMVPASGTVTLNPKITSGSTNVNLSSAVFDAYEGATACSGTISLTTATITPTTNGEITVTAGSTPGFCHFTVTGDDGTATQTEGGWIIVGNPAATLAKTTGDGQTGTKGTTLPTPLTVTLTPGSSGGTNTGASILFTTNAGTLSDGTTTGTKLIEVTNGSGVTPAVTLTLPSTAGSVTVTAEGPYGLGHPVATFTETSQ